MNPTMFALSSAFGFLVGLAVGAADVEPEVPKARQFVILVTPTGPVFGEASPSEDLMPMLRERMAAPEEPKKDKKFIPDSKGDITF